LRQEVDGPEQREQREDDEELCLFHGLRRGASASEA
jgi:hypothetical protein